MKFGKSLIRVVELSDPEWGPYWINYKFLKKKINEIVEEKALISGSTQPLPSQTTLLQTTTSNHTVVLNSQPQEISKYVTEVEFFRLLKSELRKANDFFSSTEELYKIRKMRVWEGFKMLKDTQIIHDKNTWTRLLMACVKFYKDVLLLENYAIMNYCGFSKILKKHDKLTGFSTREAFMRKVMSKQNFTHYPTVLQLIKESEKLFSDIQSMESVMPLQAEERLFIDAIRGLNHQASRLQAEENMEEITLHDHTHEIPIVDNNNNKYKILLEQNKTNANNMNYINNTNENNHNNQLNNGDVSEKLHEAASLAIEAAMKLSANSSTPDLHTIISWVHTTTCKNLPTIEEEKPSTEMKSENTNYNNSNNNNNNNNNNKNINKSSINSSINPPSFHMTSSLIDPQLTSLQKKRTISECSDNSSVYISSKQNPHYDNNKIQNNDTI
eukprot:gene4224-6000_t